MSDYDPYDDEDRLTKFGGKLDKQHEEDDVSDAEPEQKHRIEAARTEARRVNKVATLKGDKATDKDGSGTR